MTLSTVTKNNNFGEILTIITNAKTRAYKAVNSELIKMYYDIGGYISKKVNEEKWGNKTVEEFADYMEKEHPDIKGFSKQNIWRMKQFYETYKDNLFLSPLVRDLTWSNNLLIMTG
ncbi:MAG: DUF1016 N-terminal domain-containing protein, partial [Methanocorpusculum sp.]|nr:DUF1016 N-terminal domain-containing protein [Methanocorpusculum sp.]